jgi:polyhydroxyalkanoate synthase
MQALDNPLLTTAAAWRFYERMDEARHLQRGMLDALGFGPQETPSRIVLHEPGLTLKAYAEPSHSGPVILMVPAPIKRAYIWDLAPGASVVEQCMRSGARPYVLQWEEPKESFSLVDYCDRLILACAEAIGAETGSAELFLFGHSLGGLFAAVFAALHPARVQGMVAVAAPFHFEFTRRAGVLGPVIAGLVRSGLLDDAPRNVPGSFLSLASFMAAPDTFGSDRLLDWMRSLREPNAFRGHLRVERWTLDELPLARQLLRDIAGRLYGEDAFLRGTLQLSGRTAAAREVVSPLLVVADERCPIVPPEAVLPFVEAAGAVDKQLLWYEGDTGIALRHVGVLTGANAHQRLWPEILRWVRARTKD